MQQDRDWIAQHQASEICFRAVDMPLDVATAFLQQACADSAGVASTVRVLLAELGVSLPPSSEAAAPGASQIAERLLRFVHVSTTSNRSEVTPFVPTLEEPDRERTLVELIKLDLKVRWSSREPKALEAYLQEWPELHKSSHLPHLLRAECLARAVFTTPATEAEIGLRFPAHADAVRLDDVALQAEGLQRVLVHPLEASPLDPGLLSRFSVVGKIGEGGMGIVYEAIDHQREMRVALKTLPTMEPRALQQFKREFRSLAGFAQRNLVSLYELVSDGAQWFFTMELIDGTDFTSYARAEGGRPRLERLRAALQQLTEGILSLHAGGLIHCDLKPSNVLVQADGRVVILDFGISKHTRGRWSAWEATGGTPNASQAAPEVTQTNDGYLVGSLAYMSPEQTVGGRLSEASDWYAVGAMLYECLAGRAPFDGELDILTAKQHGDPCPPAGIAGSIAPDLEDLCMALLARDPSARPTGSEILDRLKLGRSRASAQVPRGNVRFVGRAAELRELAAADRAVQDSGAVMVHIRGRSGAGKTALARQFVATLPAERLVLSGRCYEQESVPYKALDSVIDSLCRHLLRLPADEVAHMISADTPALARIFPVLGQVRAIREASATWFETADARELRRRAFRALGDMLRCLARQAPVVLLIDDLQWGDVESAALLISLLSAAQPPPLLLIACYRSEHSGTNPCLLALNASRSRRTTFFVDVEPLPFESSLELASLLLEGQSDDPTFAATVARESGGNPYFVYELARHFDGRWAATLDGDRVTPDLDEALWRRVSALDAPARHLLEVVVLAGKPLPLRSVAHATALGGDLPTALATLRAERLLQTTGPGFDHQVETYHDRIRESVASRLNGSAMTGHHLNLALAFEALGHADIEETASHFHRAGVLNKAAGHYALAADKAAIALAFERAAELYRVALELDGAGGLATPSLRKRRADALANAGRGYEAGLEYQRATAGGTPGEAIELQRNAGYQYCVSGHIDEGRKAFGAVLAHLGTRLPRSRRRALASLVWRRFQLRLRGLRFRERAEESVPRVELDRVDIFWSVASGMTIADPIRGADFQTLDLLLALRAGEPYRIARALAWDAAHLSMNGVRMQSRVETQLALAEGLAQRLDLPHATGMMRMSRGVAAYFHGQFSECQQHAEAALQIFSERCTGVTWELDTCNAFALWPLYFRGDYGELARRFGSLVTQARERGARLAEADLTTFGGPLVWLAADDPDGAEQAVRSAMVEWSRDDFQVQHFTTLTANAQIALYRGDARAAWQLVADQWSGLKDAMLLRVEIVRIYMLHLRARCALAAAASSVDRARLLRAAAADARRLDRERPAYAHALGRTIRSALLVQHGDIAGGTTLLGTAIEQLERAGWGCFSTGARRQLGRLLGGETGARTVREVDAQLEAQLVKRPDLLCALQAPGFDVLRPGHFRATHTR